MNIVALKGNLTRDPELKAIGDSHVVEFTVAYNEVWRNDRNEKVEKVHFIGCVAWGKLAENIAKYFAKGSPILVEGSIVQETWEDKESQKKREKTKVKVTGFDFCGGEKKQPQAAQSSPAPAGRAATPDPDLDAGMDDIPF